MKFQGDGTAIPLISLKHQTKSRTSHPTVGKPFYFVKQRARERSSENLDDRIGEQQFRTGRDGGAPKIFPISIKFLRELSVNFFQK